MSLLYYIVFRANDSDMWLTHVEVGNDAPVADKRAPLKHAIYILIINNSSVLTVEGTHSAAYGVAPVKRHARVNWKHFAYDAGGKNSVQKKLRQSARMFYYVHQILQFSGQRWHCDKSYADSVRIGFSQSPPVSPRSAQARNSLHSPVSNPEIILVRWGEQDLF